LWKARKLRWLWHAIERLAGQVFTFLGMVQNQAILGNKAGES
jgi:hypothetical protein